MCLLLRISEQASAGGHCHIYYLLPPLMRAVGGAGKQAANREGKAAGQRWKLPDMEQSQERVKSGVIKTVGKAGPEGKQSIKASINGLNSHACAHPTPYVFTHINYPQGLPPFHCLPRIDEKINPTDPRNKSGGIPFRLVCGPLPAIRPASGLWEKGKQCLSSWKHKDRGARSALGEPTPRSTHHMTFRPSRVLFPRHLATKH